MRMRELPAVTGICLGLAASGCGSGHSTISTAGTSGKVATRSYTVLDLHAIGSKKFIPVAISDGGLVEGFDDPDAQPGIAPPPPFYILNPSTGAQPACQTCRILACCGTVLSRVVMPVPAGMRRCMWLVWARIAFR